MTLRNATGLTGGTLAGAWIEQEYQAPDIKDGWAALQVKVNEIVAAGKKGNAA